MDTGEERDSLYIENGEASYIYRDDIVEAYKGRNLLQI
jgi:hypothetical protein